MFDSMLPYAEMDLCLQEIKYRQKWLDILNDKKLLQNEIEKDAFFGIISNYTTESDDKFINHITELIKLVHIKKIESLKKRIDSIWCISASK